MSSRAFFLRAAACVFAFAPCASGCLSPGSCSSVACDPGEHCEIRADGLAACVPDDDACDGVSCPANAHCALPPEVLEAGCVCDAGFVPSADRSSCVPDAPSGCDGFDCSQYGAAHCQITSMGPQCFCDEGFAANLEGTMCVPCALDCSEYGPAHCEIEVATGAPGCFCDAGTMPNDDGTYCVEDGSDPCAGVTCDFHGTCRDVGGAPQCTCDAGYVPSADGTRCVASPSDPCSGVTCSFHGTCRDFGGTPRCECDAGYTPSADGLSCVAAATEGYMWVGAGRGPWYVGDAVYLYVDGVARGADSGLPYFSIASTGCSSSPPACSTVQADYTSASRWCSEVLRLPAGSYTLTGMLNRGGPDYAHWEQTVRVDAGTCAYASINYDERLVETGIVRGHVEDSTGRRLPGFTVSSDDGPSTTTASDGTYSLTVRAGRRARITASGPNGTMSRDVDIYADSVYPLSFIFFPL